MKMKYKEKLLKEGFCEAEAEKMEEIIKKNHNKFLKIYNDKKNCEKDIGIIYLLMTSKLKKFGITDLSYSEYKYGSLDLLQSIIVTLSEIKEKNIVQKIEKCKNRMELKKLYLDSLLILAETLKIPNEKIKIPPKFLSAFAKLKKNFKDIKILSNFQEIWSELSFQGEDDCYEEIVQSIKDEWRFLISIREKEMINTVLLFEEPEGKIMVEEIYNDKSYVMDSMKKKIENVLLEN